MTFDDLSPEEMLQRGREYLAYVNSPEGDRDLQHAMQELGLQSPSDEQRRRDARELLAYEGDFLAIETLTGAGAPTSAIAFSDLAAVTFEDFVVETVAVARDFPGVVDAWREDRELIILNGTFDEESLERRLRDWWVDRLQAVAEGQPGDSA